MFTVMKVDIKTLTSFVVNLLVQVVPVLCHAIKVMVVCTNTGMSDRAFHQTRFQQFILSLACHDLSCNKCAANHVFITGNSFNRNTKTTVEKSTCLPLRGCRHKDANVPRRIVMYQDV